MRAFAALLAALVAGACSAEAGQPVAPATPPPVASSPSASASPGQPALAALVDFPGGTGPQSTGYDLALVAADGHVAAHTHAATRASIATGGTGGGGAAALTSGRSSAANGRVYYLDGDQSVRSLAPDGTTGQVTTVPGSAAAHATFAVSPDGQQIAVGLLTYRGTSASANVYVQDLSGGGRRDIFQSSSQFGWPIGWYGGAVVLAVSSSTYSQQGLTLNPYSAAGYLVLDTSTKQVSSIGGPDFVSACEVTGLLVPAGTACYHRAAAGSAELWLLDWAGVRSRTLAVADNTTGALHPSQPTVAECCDSARMVLLARGTAAPTATALKGSDSWPCWIDGQHVLVGSVNDHQFQPGVLDVSTGQVAQVNAHGFCAAVLGQAGGGGQPNV
jgi:hypothetical protein